MKFCAFLLLIFTVSTSASFIESSAEESINDVLSAEISEENTKSIVDVMADILNIKLDSDSENEAIGQIPSYPETTLPIDFEIMKILENLREESRRRRQELNFLK